MEVGGWNEHVEETGEPAARSPLGSADTFLRLDRRDASTISLVARRGPEAGDEAVVTVLLDGLLDDSVRSERYILELRREDGGAWVLLSASWAQRCQPGRGHQAFSPRPCV